MAAYQSRMLMFQLNDVFVSLASGMNPLMVFVQQGSQIAQVYGVGQGGVRGALRDTARMIGGVVTRFPLLTAAVAAGAAAVAGMRHEINQTSDVAVSFGDVALAVWQTVRDGLVSILKPVIDRIAPWFSAAWDLVIRIKQLSQMRPLLETILARHEPHSLTDSLRGRASSERDSTSGLTLIPLKTSGSFASEDAGT